MGESTSRDKLLPSVKFRHITCKRLRSGTGRQFRFSWVCHVAGRHGWLHLWLLAKSIYPGKRELTAQRQRRELSRKSISGAKSADKIVSFCRKTTVATERLFFQRQTEHSLPTRLLPYGHSFFTNKVLQESSFQVLVQEATYAMRFRTICDTLTYCYVLKLFSEKNDF